MNTQPTLFDDTSQPDDDIEELEDDIIFRHDIIDAGEQMAYYLGHLIDKIAVHPNQMQAAIKDWRKAIRSLTTGAS